MTDLFFPNRFDSPEHSATPSQSAKQEALEAIRRLPDNVDFEEIVYRLYVLNKIHQGMKDIEEGRALSHEELRREIEQW